MIRLTGRRHLRDTFRRLRRNARLTQAQLGDKLYVHHSTIRFREAGRVHFTFDAAQQTARVFGYDVALIPQRHPGARPTGTGWPA
jgi:DNA-binding XRE family transcriptional regulator